MPSSRRILHSPESSDNLRAASLVHGFRNLGHHNSFSSVNTSCSEYGSIVAVIFRTMTLGVLWRPKVSRVMKPLASSLFKVRVTFGCDRPLSSASAAIEAGLASRIIAKSRRFSDVRRRTTDATQLNPVWWIVGGCLQRLLGFIFYSTSQPNAGLQAHASRMRAYHIRI